LGESFVIAGKACRGAMDRAMLGLAYPPTASAKQAGQHLGVVIACLMRDARSVRIYIGCDQKKNAWCRHDVQQVSAQSGVAANQAIKPPFVTA
jgi:hypothetical protein